MRSEYQSLSESTNGLQTTLLSEQDTRERVESDANISLNRESMRYPIVHGTSTRTLVSTGYLYAFREAGAEAALTERAANFGDAPAKQSQHGTVKSRLNVLWVFISCGYMVSFTSIGSLIGYFKATQGSHFYVQLYCAFYLPGLPVSLLQQYNDGAFDRRLGSQPAFLVRVLVGMAVQIAVLFALPFLEPWPFATITAMFFIGIGSWICHGTAGQLCSMFPPSSTAFLQTGFRTPEIYSLVAVALLGLGANASSFHVGLYYYLTAVFVIIGMLSWVAVVRSTPAREYFRLKDLGELSEDAKNGLAAEIDTGADSDSEDGLPDETFECVASVIRPCRVVRIPPSLLAVFSSMLRYIPH